MFTSLGVEGLEPMRSPLFREAGQPPQLNIFEPSGRILTPRRGRPTLEEQAQVRPSGQSGLLDWLKSGEARSTATGSTGNPRAVLSPTSAAVEQALASSGLPPVPKAGEGRYRRGRKY